MLSKLLAFADLLVRLFDLAIAGVNWVKRKERERRNEEIDRDPAGEFSDHFGGVRDHERQSVPGDQTDAERGADRKGRDSDQR